MYNMLIKRFTYEMVHMLYFIYYEQSHYETLVTAQNLIVCFSYKIHRWLKIAVSDSSGYLDVLLGR